MTIKEYIDKNLPSLNWNILPQIFEVNDVELTEEIGKYLKETPWNTNWAILRHLNKSDSSDEEQIELPAKLICVEGIYYNELPEGSSWATTEEAWNWINQNYVEINGHNYIEGTKLHLVDSIENLFDNFTEQTNGWVQENSCNWGLRNYSIELSKNEFSVQYED